MGQADASRQNGRHPYVAMLDASPTPMGLLRGPDFVFEYVNPRYTELIGNRPTVGRRFVEVFHELDHDAYLSLLARVLQTGVAHVERRRAVRFIHTPGAGPEERYVDFGFARICGPDGQPYGVCAYVVDVDEQVRAQQQVADSVRARDDFLGFCSHELKNPLAALQLSTQNLRRRLDRADARATSPERVRQTLLQWDRVVERMVRLIDTMADFSRVHRGMLKLACAPCALDEVATEVLERFGPQLRAAGVEVRASVRPVRGCWDAGRLDQVCSNLLTNALKYGGGTPVALEVFTRGKRAVLRVRDHGPGMAAVDLQRIFLAYERASATHEAGSLGVGLYLSRRIAEAHGGSLDVVSAPGEGASFTLELPLDAAP